MRVEVDSKIDHREFTKRETGEVFKFSEQQAYMHFDDGRYPLPFALSLPEDKPQGWTPGFYSIGIDSFQINRNRIELKRYLDLIPETSKAPAKVAG